MELTFTIKYLKIHDHIGWCEWYAEAQEIVINFIDYSCYKDLVFRLKESGRHNSNVFA